MKVICESKIKILLSGIKSLITHRFLFDNVLEAYDILLKGNSLGIVLQYKPSDLAKRNEIIILNESCLSMFLHLL
jgi:hypothetical protein